MYHEFLDCQARPSFFQDFIVLLLIASNLLFESNNAFYKCLKSHSSAFLLMAENGLFFTQKPSAS